MDKKKIIAIVILSFVCGLFAGGIAYKFIFKYFNHHNKKGFQQAIFQKLDRELNLDINQKIATRQALEEMDNDLKNIKKEYCPKKQMVFKQSFNKIKNSLSAEQKIKFDNSTAKIRQRINSCRK